MKLLTCEQVGEILLFQPQKIRKMIIAGEIPALKIGGEYRIKAEELTKYLEMVAV